MKHNWVPCDYQDGWYCVRCGVQAFDVYDPKEECPTDSAAPAAPPAVSAETAEPGGSASAPNHTLPPGPPPTAIGEALHASINELCDRLDAATFEMLRLASDRAELRASMLRAADMIGRGNPGGAEAELREALKERP